MLFAQLSDIHVGPNFRKDVFERAVDEVNHLDPDAVLVTGDLTENGMLQEYERAREYIGRLRSKNIIVLGGNHDYRNTGYLLYKKFFRSKPLHEFDDCVLATLGTARPDRDEGEVGYRQNIWLLRTLSRYRDRTKIVAMHHHLIAAPDTGSDRIIVLDAGDVLQTALTAKVKLVLCGHKHRPWSWNLGPLTIAFAGTVSCDRMRGFFENSYNIITVEKGRIGVELKVVGGRRMHMHDVVKQREVVED